MRVLNFMAMAAGAAAISLTAEDRYYTGKKLTGTETGVADYIINNSMFLGAGDKISASKCYKWFDDDLDRSVTNA